MKQRLWQHLSFFILSNSICYLTCLCLSFLQPYLECFSSKFAPLTVHPCVCSPGSNLQLNLVLFMHQQICFWNMIWSCHLAMPCPLVQVKSQGFHYYFMSRYKWFPHTVEFIQIQHTLWKLKNKAYKKAFWK